VYQIKAKIKIKKIPILWYFFKKLKNKDVDYVLLDNIIF